MGAGPHQPGLFVGPHIDEVLEGADLAAFRARLTNAGALALFDYWCRLLRAHGLRMKPAFDPVEVPRARDLSEEERDLLRRLAELGGQPVREAGLVDKVKKKVFG